MTDRSSILLTRASLDGSRVAVEWEDGGRGTFPSIWLRDNCSCERCRHPGSGQRLIDLAALPSDLAPLQLTTSLHGLDAVWSEGHTSRYSSSWLRDHASEQAAQPAATLWTAALQSHIPQAEFEEVSSNGRALCRWLAAVEEYGFAVLHGVPPRTGEVIRVVDLFGYVRETNYGRLFDVHAVVNPTNLAFTGLSLGVHTDNPYREPTPTLQLLHCLQSTASGGENTLVDGFRVANDLRERAPEQFTLLARYPIPFRYQDAETDLRAEFPVITLAPDSAISAIHFNNRSRQPLSLPFDIVEAYYEALRTFGAILESEEYKVQVKLEPGDLLIMDNERVLHGRTGYAETGERHLQGCYADRDGLRSTVAVLRGKE